MFVAANGMLDLIQHKLCVHREDAAALASVSVDLRITQIVNKSFGVHALWRESAISG